MKIKDLFSTKSPLKNSRPINPYLSLQNNLENKLSKEFGKYSFNLLEMKKRLPPSVYDNIVNAVHGFEKIKIEYADQIASALKTWAQEHGATHYTHWFQPLTGLSAEKHDSFLEVSKTGEFIEKFSGAQLIQGEPDASSFPTGGLRSTYEARGYTGWDPTSAPFIWKTENSSTLCIPTVFFSWKGDVLDYKIPLLRSDKLINDACKRLFKLTKIQATSVFSSLGLEQEYFLVDKQLHDTRADMVILGKTVFGNFPAKGQELQDHYFGAVKDHIMSFMQEFECEAVKLGIPIKTRHNEVAPSQHEIACIYEKASLCIDHNLQLMELMKKIALQNDLVCLFHEKPFKDLNGSGKHSNWSLTTNTGINLLDPTQTPENQFHFLILLTAILDALYNHAALLRATIGSRGNDFRLGAQEAPPAIISVFLGDELESLLDNIEQNKDYKSPSAKEVFNSLIPALANLPKDNTDRNRTASFAFTGNKFEFRSVGSSSNPSFIIATLNVIVAHSLNKILDEIESSEEKNIKSKIFPILRKYIKKSKNVRFTGDNYSESWLNEAKNRNLPNTPNSYFSFEAFKDPNAIEAFQGVLTKKELESFCEIQKEKYLHTLKIEKNLMIEMFTSQILPSAIKYQKEMADSIIASHQLLKEVIFIEQKHHLKKLSELIERSLRLNNELQKITSITSKNLTSTLKLIENFRSEVDQLEQVVDDSIWPFAKYRELLFLM